jgi:hypothetical protein
MPQGLCFFIPLRFGFVHGDALQICHLQIPGSFPNKAVGAPVIHAAKTSPYAVAEPFQQPEAQEKSMSEASQQQTDSLDHGTSLLHSDIAWDYIGDAKFAGERESTFQACSTARRC